jgi:hypothetical protein
MSYSRKVPEHANVKGVAPKVPSGFWVFFRQYCHPVGFCKGRRYMRYISGVPKMGMATKASWSW